MTPGQTPVIHPAKPPTWTVMFLLVHKDIVRVLGSLPNVEETAFPYPQIQSFCHREKSDGSDIIHH